MNLYLALVKDTGFVWCHEDILAKCFINISNFHRGVTQMRVYLLLNACSTNPFASICQGISNVFYLFFRLLLIIL